MADITKCEGANCPIKENCYRYTAKANEFRQSYFTDPPIKDGKCEMYWGENSQRIWNQLNDIVKAQRFVALWLLFWLADTYL